MRVVIDAMGGDHAPEAIIKGTIMALEQYPQLNVILTGQEQAIQPYLDDAYADRITVLPASEVIGTDEEPLAAIRRKKDSSILVGLNLLKEKQADAFLSAGSTGAVMSGALFYVGRIKGVQRPALAPVMPTKSGCALLIDVGANAECKESHLVQFAHMGSAYMQMVQGISHPRVALVNIGAEEEKGNALYKQVHQMLKNSPLNFVGNAEARDLFDGVADVYVCDGFTGNMLLKSIEGTANYIMSMLKGALYTNLKTKIAAMMIKNNLKDMKKALDYTEYGGSPLLGIDGCVIKAHGSSDAKAFAAAVGQAVKYVEHDVTGAIAGQLKDSL